MPEQDKMEDVLNWCASALGPVAVVADYELTRQQPGETGLLKMGIGR